MQHEITRCFVSSCVHSDPCPMPLKKLVIDDRGIDPIEVHDYEPPDDPSEIGDDLDYLNGYFAGVAAAHKFDAPWADAVYDHKVKLIKAGLPCRNGYYKQSSDEWQRWAQSDLYELSTLEVFAGRRPPSDLPPSPPLGYANLCSLPLACIRPDAQLVRSTQIVTTYHQIKLARAAGLNHVCEALAFRQGTLVSREEFKAAAEDTWLIGRRVR